MAKKLGGIFELAVSWRQLTDRNGTIYHPVLFSKWPLTIHGQKKPEKEFPTKNIQNRRKY